MNIKNNPKALNILSQKDIKAISSNEELQQKINNMLNSNFEHHQKVAYIKKLVELKIEKKEKRNYSIKELLKIIPIPQRTQRTLRKIRKKNYEQFIKIHKDITKIVVDPSKNDMTKLDRIKKLLWNLSNKRKSGITYNTYNQQLMLALISENSGIDRKQLRAKMQVQEKAVMRNLKKLQEESLLVETKHRRKFLYSLSEKGKLEANELTLSFLNRGSLNASKKDTHFKNDSVEKKDLLCSQRIAATKQVDRKLRNLGIYGPRVREFLEKYSLEHIVELYNKVIHQERIENKGAYIYKVLSDSCPKSLRIRSFVNFHLRGVLSREVCNMFSQEAQSLSMRIAMWLGHSLKRLAKKTTVLPCNVHVALHRIYKQMAGTTNNSKPATAHSKASYTERNRAYEIMRIEEEKDRLQYC